jgi:hypothetical protein
MNFNTIDPLLRAWASRNSIPLSTRYKEDEVRSFELAGPVGRAQIWVEVNGGITVNVWDYRKRRQNLPADATTLERLLDEALIVARAWCDKSDTPTIPGRF